MMRTAITKAVFLAVLLCGLVVPPAQAEVRILASPGGQVGPFLDLFERVRASGERVVIDGPCLSACTLVLSAVPTDRICVTRRAVLGFHAARSMDSRGRLYAEPEASAAVLEAYPSPVRSWIRRRGGLTSRVLLLRGRELAAIYLLPGSWGKGLGRELMTAGLSALSEAAFDEATLWVLDTNSRARRFYEAAGWHADGAGKQDDGRGFVLNEVRYRRPLP